MCGSRWVQCEVGCVGASRQAEGILSAELLGLNRSTGFGVAESDLKIPGLSLLAGWVMGAVHEFFFSWSFVFYDHKCGACLHMYLNRII